jgi:GNAT superfamily N-acetyltransferase
VPYEAYVEYITQRGKGWLSIEEDTITGFAVVDMQDHNVWALFVDPPFEGRGAARALQQTMLEWYFTQTDHTLWLGTAPDSRAAAFYRKSGWTEIGLRKNGEIRFEMTKTDWERISSS